MPSQIRLLTDPTDILVTAGISGVVSLVVSVLVPRYLQRRDQRREEDQKRLYETLHKETSSALEGENRALSGYNPYWSAEELHEMQARGALLPERHRALRENIDQLVSLRGELDEAHSVLSNMIEQTVQHALDTNILVSDHKSAQKNLGDIFGHKFVVDGPMFSALATGDKESWQIEIQRRVNAASRNLATIIEPERGPDEMFDDIDPTLRPYREMYMSAAKDLFALTHRINENLEEALRTGKAYKPRER